MNVVTLKTGKEEVEALVTVTRMTLSLMLELSESILFYEAVMIAKDHNHDPWGDSKDKLKVYGLLESDGRMHDSVRNIILASVEGEWLDMRLVNPFTA